MAPADPENSGFFQTIEGLQRGYFFGFKAIRLSFDLLGTAPDRHCAVPTRLAL
jgi:hypothetical protein